MAFMTADIGIITVSDRASEGVYEDRSGPAIEAWLQGVLVSSWQPIIKLIPDEQPLIEETICSLCEHCGLVVTTGGTGPAPRDVTPEATEAVCDRMLPGFGELMRQESLKVVPTAILSRQVAGIRGSSLVINLPGKPSAISDCLNAVFAAVPYCLDLIGGPQLETNPDQLVAFRPGATMKPS